MPIALRSAALAFFVASLPGCTTPTAPAYQQAGAVSYDFATFTAYIDAGHDNFGLPSALFVAKDDTHFRRMLDNKGVYAVFMMQREIDGVVTSETFDPWKLIDLVHEATDAGKQT